jgi:hypothetical protein
MSLVLLCDRCATALGVVEETCMGIDVKKEDCERCARPLLPSTYSQVRSDWYEKTMLARGEQP